jgi:hypothetical protein
MICNCGATVKASGNAAGITRFSAEFEADPRTPARKMGICGRGTARRQRPGTYSAKRLRTWSEGVRLAGKCASPIPQDCGTIDARSNGDDIKSADGE